MNKRKSSNLSGSTVILNETLGSQAFHFSSAPTKKVSAPSIYDIVFGVEGPNINNIEMLHKINCINCNGDVTKRWYVEYYITYPETNKSVRKREYGFVNKEKDADKRLILLQRLKQEIIGKLELESNSQLNFACKDGESITHYLNDFLRQKRKVLAFDSVRTYVKDLKKFHQFLLKNNLSAKPPVAISKQQIIDFRNELTELVGNRTANNVYETVKIFFEYIIKNHENVLIKNPCSNIQKLPSKSESHIAYTKLEAEKLSKYLEENDKQMLTYCRFIGLGFLRCKETRNLKIGDIDFDKKTITLTAKSAKTGNRTIKPMLDTLYNYLLDLNLDKYPSNYYVFSGTGFPGVKRTYDNYFQRKYQPLKKKFGLTSKHTIYSFRHTMVCELLNSGASWHEIMKYTGHTTFAAFEKYARSILNKPATDLSSSIKIKF